MGKARYYCKATYDTVEAAEAALPKINSFLELMAKCEDEWQRTRDSGKEADDKLRSVYGEVFEKLGISTPKKYDSSLSYLADVVCSPAHSDDFECVKIGTDIQFSGTVWHFANWEPLAKALKDHFGAKLSGWTSDEYNLTRDGRIKEVKVWS